MILDRIGLGNLVAFISTYIANTFTHFITYDGWMKAMFLISATSAAIYGVAKLYKILFKNKNNNE